MFRLIQNESLKKERIRVRIRGAFLAKKGAPKLNFHREGGQLPPSAPLNPLLPGAVRTVTKCQSAMSFRYTGILDVVVAFKPILKAFY